MKASGPRTVLLVLVGLALVLPGRFSFGQAMNATLLGTVTDATNAVVVNAKITVTEMQTGITRSTTTNQSGNYEFPNLAPGRYSITAEQQGFRRETQANVDVSVNSTVRTDLKMVPGAVSETVTVNDTPPALQTDRADIGEKIEATQLSELPVGGPVRNFQGLLALVPGTVRPHRDHSE